MCRIWCNFAIEAAHVPCASCSEIQLCLVQVEKELSILPDHCSAMYTTLYVYRYASLRYLCFHFRIAN